MVNGLLLLTHQTDALITARSRVYIDECSVENRREVREVARDVRNGTAQLVLIGKRHLLNWLVSTFRCYGVGCIEETGKDRVAEPHRWIRLACLERVEIRALITRHVLWEYNALSPRTAIDVSSFLLRWRCYFPYIPRVRYLHTLINNQYQLLSHVAVGLLSKHHTEK